jgi:hypothetical protein
LRVVRPYASEAELLAAEGWTVNMQRVVLIGERPLKRGTVVRVELALSNGEKILRAEGKVAGVSKSAGDLPKGLEVRLKRYGASTRAFLERAARAADELPSLPEIDSSPTVTLEREIDSSPAASGEALPESDRSGVHVRIVEAPADRDALLERLRERARLIASARLRDE